ncbi:alpha-12-mannosyltransferase (Mnn2) [Pyrenophora seminiperda CCB06]|uniref:Alpha-12-mannosyltransferase (Mnn2) n=1 Tax=Pyrenophora seminiperda CCB06 TaxID=1302712 RepID=A0A3M7M0U1_9PLEO|nr:alpha-12-mannosyltransferase (Mnn2) [Pyrenophora seminiperda CCB06]
MLVSTAHVTSSIPRLLLLPLVFFICGLFLLPRQYHGSAAIYLPIVTGKNLTEASSTFDASVRQFWYDLATALVESQPQCDSLKLDENLDDKDAMAKFLPLEPHKEHPQKLVNFTDKDEKALFRAHYAMRSSAQHLASRVPFAKDTTGIVTTANADYMPIFLVSLRMLRKTGCSLPVEVFIDDWSKYDSTVCDQVLPSLNARCVVLSNIYNTAAHAKQPNHYQYKIFAILFSSFQNVLFLDSDDFPAYDPTDLFSKAPYTTHGLVTWPDFWAQTISSHFYHIAAIPEVPSQSRLSTESGQLLINKDIHRESLLMMVYYNYYGPDYYYILLSQGSPGAGDKETFVQAALAVGLPYYQVRTPPSALGRMVNGSYIGTGISQADPTLDYKYLLPLPNHIHKGDSWQDADLVNPGSKAPPRPKALFLHQNNLKLDPARVLDDERTYDLDGTTPQRLWQNNANIDGIDIERVLWTVIAEEGCRENKASETCRRLEEHLVKLFG